MNCHLCENNCTSMREKCCEKDACQGWFVYKTSSLYHAGGIRIGIKFDYTQTQDSFLGKKYKYGCVWTRSSEVIADWRLSDLKLDWNELDRPYKPTLKERILKIFGKDYPQFLRPDNNSIVILKYGSTHYEIAEYSNGGCWVTRLYFPCKPTHWAYLPAGITRYETKKGGDK